MIVTSRKHKGTTRAPLWLSPVELCGILLRGSIVWSRRDGERESGGDGRALAYRLTAYCSLKGWAFKGFSGVRRKWLLLRRSMRLYSGYDGTYGTYEMYWFSNTHRALANAHPLIRREQWRNLKIAVFQLPAEERWKSNILNPIYRRANI